MRHWEAPVNYQLLLFLSLLWPVQEREGLWPEPIIGRRRALDGEGRKGLSLTSLGLRRAEAQARPLQPSTHLVDRCRFLSSSYVLRC